MRVLIVEDDVVVGEVLRDFLRGLGHEPDLVRSAEEALRRLEHGRPPQLVLLDFRLPGMSGLDFLKLPLVRASHVPIIVVSGIATEGQARECLQEGAVDFVAKPIRFDHLQRLLEILEPQVRVQTASPVGRPVDRRRLPRARVALPVRVRPDAEREWATTSVDLSIEAMKVRAGDVPRPGPTARLSFVAPEDDERLEVDSVLIRVDLDGCVFFFLNLTERHFDRLRRLVARLTARQRPLCAGPSGQGFFDGGQVGSSLRRARRANDEPEGTNGTPTRLPFGCVSPGQRGCRSSSVTSSSRELRRG